MGELGADILAALIPAAIFVAAIFVGNKVFQKTQSALWGWVAAIALLVAASVIFGPSLKMLRSEACEGSDDYSSCLDPGDVDYL